MKYIKYLFYIIEHKWNVGIECLKMGLYIHAFTHDLSKFLPSEFIPYAKYFYGGKHNKDSYNKVWKLHYSRNKHHWDYWTYWKQDGNPMWCPPLKQVSISMPKKYVQQMIADWRGMGRKFNDTAEEYYSKNKHKMLLHYETDAWIKTFFIL